MHFLPILALLFVGGQAAPIKPLSSNGEMTKPFGLVAVAPGTEYDGLAVTIGPMKGERSIFLRLKDKSGKSAVDNNFFIERNTTSATPYSHLMYKSADAPDGLTLVETLETNPDTTPAPFFVELGKAPANGVQMAPRGNMDINKDGFLAAAALGVSSGGEINWTICKKWKTEDKKNDPTLRWLVRTPDGAKWEDCVTDIKFKKVSASA